MKRALTIACLCLLPGMAMAQDARYRACLARADGAPQAALGEASAWEKNGGGAAAAHCGAVALVGLRRYAEAGAKLNAVARRGDIPTAMRGDLLAQAGNAFLLAGDANQAYAALSGALILKARDPDIYLDLARVQAMRKEWAGAESSLNAAMSLAPRADLLILRASARHAQGKKKEALADLDRALVLSPQSNEALLQRGAMRAEAGDAAGARADLTIVIARAPSLADAARQQLAALNAPPPSQAKTPARRP